MKNEIWLMENLHGVVEEKKGRIKKTSQFPGIKGVWQNLHYVFKEHPAKARVKL